MADPIFTASAGYYTVSWPDEQIFMRLDRLSEGRGFVHAEIRIQDTASEEPRHLHHARLNLLSTTARKELSKQMLERINTYDWWEMVEAATLLTLDHYRAGEPMHELLTSDSTSPVEYLIYPIIPANQTTIIFGDGGMGKSQMAELLALCILTGWADNPFGLGVKGICGNVLWLDWETDRNTVLWILKRLQVGMGRDHCSLHYKRMYRPLSQELPEVQELMLNIKPSLLVLDSIGPAIATDVNTADSASQLIGRDIRSLNTTTLCIAHTSKGEGGKKTVIGSVLFQNLARSVWELRKSQETGAQRLQVGLFCKKANISQLYHPIGLDFAFEGDEAIMVDRTEIEDVPDLAQSLPIHEQIKFMLKHQSLTVKEISEGLEITETHARKELNRFKNRFFRLPDGEWGLLSHET